MYHTRPFDEVYPEPFDFAQDRLRRRGQGMSCQTRRMMYIVEKFLFPIMSNIHNIFGFN
jgi:hypothetical protein